MKNVPVLNKRPSAAMNDFGIALRNVQAINYQG